MENKDKPEETPALTEDKMEVTLATEEENKVEESKIVEPEEPKTAAATSESEQSLSAQVSTGWLLTNFIRGSGEC